jgi:hypothetical protein
MSEVLKISKLALAAIWLWLMPIHPALISVMCLPIVDLALALLCARKAGRPLTSSGLKRTVGKVLMYESATILAFVVEIYLIGDLLPAVKVVTGLIGMTELKSCLEHLDELGGSPLFASILNKLAPGQPNNEDSQSNKEKPL